MGTLEYVMVSIAAVFIVLLGWIFGGLYHTAKLEVKCLEAGYSGSRVTYNYEGYCTKRDRYGATVVIKEKDIK